MLCKYNLKWNFALLLIKKNWCSIWYHIHFFAFADKKDKLLFVVRIISNRFFYFQNCKIIILRRRQLKSLFKYNKKILALQNFTRWHYMIDFGFLLVFFSNISHIDVLLAWRNCSGDCHGWISRDNFVGGELLSSRRTHNTHTHIRAPNRSPPHC